MKITSQHAQSVLLIFKHLYKYGIKNNKQIHFGLILTGVASKILNLMAMVVMLQAIVAVLLPKHILAIFAKINSALGLDLNSTDIMPFMAALIIVTQAIASLIQYLHIKLQTVMVDNVLQVNGGVQRVWVIDHDLYMVNAFLPALQSLSKFATALGYIIILYSIIAYFSFHLAVLILILVLVATFILVLNGKKELLSKKTFQSLKSEFVRSNKLAVIKTIEPADYFNSVERAKFLSKKSDLMMANDAKLNIAAALNAILIVVVLFFISSGIIAGVEHLTSSLIFLLFAIRSLIGAGREVANNVSKVLELRGELRVIESMQTQI